MAGIRGESPLQWLERRGHISAEMLAAGERLAADWHLTQFEARVTMDWRSLAARQDTGPRPRDGLTHEERSLAARARVEAALAVVGPELSGMLLEVCCLTRGMEAAEQSLGLPQRAGKVVLHLALTRLARHYGLLPPPPRPRAISGWGAEGFRPSIPPRL